MDRARAGVQQGGGESSRGVRPALRELRSGAALVVRAARLLRAHRELAWLAAIPVALSVVALVSALWLLMGNAGGVLAWLGSVLPQLEATAWYTWLWVGPARLLSWLAQGLLFVLVAAATALASLLLAKLLSSPVLEVLSQRVERIAAGRVGGDGAGAGGLLRDAWRSLSAEARRLAFLGAVWAGVWAVGLVVPGGPALVPLALGAVSLYFLPLEFAGPALDRRGASFAQRRAWLRERRPRAIGFGAVAFAIGVVPGLNFVSIPLLVVAGTLLVIEAPPAADRRCGV